MTKRILLIALLLGAALAFAPEAAQAQLNFHPVSPCRVLNPQNFTDGATNTQSFQVRGLCGIPTAAQAVAFNVTAQQTGVGVNTTNGNFKVYPHDVALPTASTINFVAGQNIANGAVVMLDADTTGGGMDVKATLFAATAGRQCNLILDVTGYFSNP